MDQLFPQRPLRVFLCHSSTDKVLIRDLYRRLSAEGIETWLDEENLLPGQEWDQEIRKAVRGSDAVLACLSRSATTKPGYLQKEIKLALDVADEQPEGTIFLIPLRLEDCEVPDRLRRWQWVNFYEPNGYGHLMRSLAARAAAIGATTSASPVNESVVDRHPTNDGPFTSFIGGWWHHGFMLEVFPDGHGIAQWRTYRWCGPGVDPPCDWIQENLIRSGGSAQFMFRRVDQATAYGEAIDSNDPSTIPVGPTLLTLLPYGMARLWTQTASRDLCGPRYLEEAPPEIQRLFPCGA
jgi:hypothetical protein